MKFKSALTVALTIATLFCGVDFARAQFTAFTYQGNLTVNGAAATGAFDFQFGLFTNSTGGTAIVTVTNLNVEVTGGLFTTAIDFGNAFNGTPFWLDIAARSNGSTGAFTELTNRQALTATPYSLFTPSIASRDYLLAYDTTTQSVTTPGTFQTILFNTPGAGTNGWTLSGILPDSTFTASDSGVYLIRYDAELTGTAGRTVSFHTQVNNLTEQPDSQAAVTLGTGTVTQISKTFLATINMFDVLRLQFTADGSGVSIAPAGTGTIRAGASLVITRIQ